MTGSDSWCVFLSVHLVCCWLTAKCAVKLLATSLACPRNKTEFSQLEGILAHTTQPQVFVQQLCLVFARLATPSSSYHQLEAAKLHLHHQHTARTAP